MHDPYIERLDACTSRATIADCLLDKALEFSEAPMGNVQLLDGLGQVLAIRAQRGFEREFLDAFARVDGKGGSVCAQALRRREAVTVEDVAAAGSLSAHASVFARAGVRAIRSVPLIAHDGELTGMVSVHFREPRKTSLAELVTLTRFATLAADRLATVARGKAKDGARPGIPSARRPSKANLHAWAKLGFKTKP